MGVETVAIKHLRQTCLATRWNISPRTLERWRWLGDGPPFIKIGGRVVYRLEDIEAACIQMRAGVDVTVHRAVEQIAAGSVAFHGHPNLA